MFNLISSFLCIHNSCIIKKFKEIPISLSETAYMLGGNKKYLFTLYTVIIAVTLLPSLFNITTDSLEFLPFLMCAGLLFAGFTPAFKKSLDNKVHYTAAIISFICFIIYTIVFIGWIWLVFYLVILLSLLLIWGFKYYMYFAEMLAIFSLAVWLI